MPLVFTDEFAALPASCAPDKMHIIDAGRLTPAEYHSENINVWDSVATVLFKISPKVLSSFLDSHGSSYKVIMTPQPSSGRLRNLIWRKETQFMVGTFMPRDFEGRVIYEWNYLICCECDNDRGWKVATTSYRLYSEATIESFWKGSAAALINIATLKLEDASRQREYANGIAMSMLLSIKTWELDRPGQWDIEIDEDPGVSAAEVSAAAVRRPTRSTRRPARYI